MHFLAVTQCPAFILKENVRDGMSRCKIVPTLMRYSFFWGIDQVMWQKQTWKPLKASLWRCTQNWVKYHWQIYESIRLNLWRTTTCGSYHQAGEPWNNTLEELFIKLVMFGKSQLVISLSLILKTGMGIWRKYV